MAAALSAMGEASFQKKEYKESEAYYERALHMIEAYIGKTVGTIENRWKEHCREAKQNRSNNRPLYIAIRKYGIEYFNVI